MRFAKQIAFGIKHNYEEIDRIALLVDRHINETSLVSPGILLHSQCSNFRSRNKHIYSVCEDQMESINDLEHEIPLRLYY